MCVYKMGNLRVVDLTKELDPKTESRRCHMYRFNTGGPIPDYHTIMDIVSALIITMTTGRVWRSCR